METYIEYIIEVLVRDSPDASTDEKLKIRVNREEDIFTLFLGNQELCFGTWTDNLLNAIESIVHIEKTIET